MGKSDFQSLRLTDNNTLPIDMLKLLFDRQHSRTVHFEYYYCYLSFHMKAINLNTVRILEQASYFLCNNETLRLLIRGPEQTPQQWGTQYDKHVLIGVRSRRKSEEEKD